MNASSYIQSIGRINPTYGSKVISTAKNFFDRDLEKERENERILHAKKIISFLRSC